MENQTEVGYFAPQTLEEVVDILAKLGSEVKILAGGTDLLVRYYERLYEVDNWLDLSKLDKLERINDYSDRVEIGAGIRHVELEKSEKINNYFPILSQAASDVGSPQIRNRGTIGGNIVNASPAGDLLPGLLAYKARFKLVSNEDERIVPAKEFFVGPGQTELKPEELLTKVIIPKPKERTYCSWQKIGMTKTVAISTVSLALLVRLADDNQTVEEARACFGSIAPTPVEVKEVGQEMISKEVNRLDFIALGQLVADIISPIDDVRGTKEYRQQLAKGIMVDALKEIDLKR